MSFLQPLLLLGLPLALLPIIIHLINQHRHRTVKWAAMMFLLDAKKLTKGVARLRQILILSLRVIAVLVLIFAAGRPLAGGWLSFSGGKPDTVLILLDRSSSMEDLLLETGESKRSAAITKLADLVEKTARTSNLVLIDSATLEATQIADPTALIDLPQVATTSTQSDIPSLLESAINYLETDASGRTDIWVASDLRQSDWKPGSGKWPSIRSELAARSSVGLFLLNYATIDEGNLAVSLSNVKRRRSPEGMQLVMDLRITRPSAADSDTTLPVEFTINGTRTVQEMTIQGGEMVRLGHTLPLGSGDTRGWGRVDLPADGNPIDNTAFFVFDESAVRKTVIVTEDGAVGEAIAAAAQAAVETEVVYEADILSPQQVARIPWDDTALLFWHAPIPEPAEAVHALLRQHAESGRTLVFLPPAGDGGGSLFGFQWSEWLDTAETPFPFESWRTESGLLANTRNGDPLPVSEVSVFRARDFSGDVASLLRLEDSTTLFAQITTEAQGSVYSWGTLPRTDHSSLATEGIVFFVMVHRALEEGANAVAPAQYLETRRGAFTENSSQVEIDSLGRDGGTMTLGLLPGAFRVMTSSGTERLFALHRPLGEDDIRQVSPQALASLLEGVEFRQVSDELSSGSSLASEIWRLFLVIMALALLAEAILSLPARPAEDASSATLASFPDPSGK